MKKTIISVWLIVALLFSCCSCALMEGNTPQEKLDNGILWLETYLASGGTTELVDLEMIANQFASVGSYGNARGFYQYAMLLSAVEKKDFKETERWIAYLESNSQFNVSITEKDFTDQHLAIASVEVLLEYCRARELEHQGQLYEAMNIYVGQSNFYDAWNRCESISQQLNVMPGDVPTPSPTPKATATPEALRIVSQPSVVNVKIGDTALAKITAVGGGLTYRWFVRNPGKSTFAESSVTGDTYSYEMVLNKSGRQVYCVVTDYTGKSVMSDIITFSAKVKVGDYVTFGAYEQDAVTSNGKEAIEWLVLDKDDDRILVISRYVLDAQLYNSTYTNVAWPNCSLRGWLNETFISEAFTASEQKIIVSTRNSNDNGMATNDQVFLLSVDEVKWYLPNDKVRCVRPTAYAKANGAFANSAGNVWWWTRTTGRTKSHAAGVYGSGKMDESGASVNMKNGVPVNGVRPAMWLDVGQ